ncbi:MAG: MNIO family bufferin maturase [Hyphomicrobiaceae bacterium]
MRSGFPVSDRKLAVALPRRAGVSLKPEHYASIVAERPNVGWFEVHPENYMGAGGPPHRYLEAVREHYPLSLHGVGLSIGSAGRLDGDHLARLKALVDRYDPAQVSEHLAWSTHDEGFLNDLLPLPYTEETLDTVCTHIDEVQTAIDRRMLLENPATYVVFPESTYDEIAFLEAIVERTGCGLLLDVNNVYVSSTNHNRCPEDYIDRFPLEHVGEVHLAGHAEDKDDHGNRLLIDSHDRLVVDAVWKLYDRVIRRAGALPTLIEWDSEIPAWPVLFSEAERAEAVMAAHTGIGEHASTRPADHELA